jgi:hypothetical protein
VHFALGRLYENQGDYTATRLAYLDARDRDQSAQLAKDAGLEEDAARLLRRVTLVTE